MRRQTIETVWHCATDESPAESGYYLVDIDGGALITTVHYSKKHDMWNARDWYEKEQAATMDLKGVTYWAELPELPPVESRRKKYE